MLLTVSVVLSAMLVLHFCMHNGQQRHLKTPARLINANVAAALALFFLELENAHDAVSRSVEQPAGLEFCCEHEIYAMLACKTSKIINTIGKSYRESKVQ